VGDAATRGDFVRTVSASSSQGNASVQSAGTIAAAGGRAIAVDVQAGGLASVAVHDVTVTGPRCDAILAEGNEIAIAIVNTGAVAASGGGVGGIYAHTLGNVTISGTSSVTTRGDDATGIRVDAGEAVSIPAGGIEAIGD